MERTRAFRLSSFVLAALRDVLRFGVVAVLVDSGAVVGPSVSVVGTVESISSDGLERLSVVGATGGRLAVVDSLGDDSLAEDASELLPTDSNSPPSTAR